LNLNHDGEFSLYVAIVIASSFLNLYGVMHLSLKNDSGIGLVFLVNSNFELGINPKCFEMFLGDFY